jgi:hypothetical protein
MRLIGVAATPTVALDFAGAPRGRARATSSKVKAITYQSIGYFDPFPWLLRLDRVLQTDFLKLPRLRRILSQLAAGRQRIRLTRKPITGR